MSKILCRHHNSALSPYDHEASRLSRFLLQNVVEKPTAAAAICLDGNRLERWALKTFTNLGYIGALDPHNHCRLPPPEDIVECLFRNRVLPEGIGLYLVSGSLTNHAFSTGLWWNVINNKVNGDVLGMSVSLSGLRFVLNVVPTRAEAKIASMGVVNGVDYGGANIYYRPSNVILGSSSAGPKRIDLQW